MEKIAKSMRLHIAFFGKRNAGKSSLINNITEQEISIVSDIAGTTTDAVEKAMEIPVLGPVVLIDTAGIDDEGELGAKRIHSTKKIIERTDAAVIVCDYTGWNEYEISLAKELKDKNIPFITVINKSDKGKISAESLNEIKKYTQNIIETSMFDEKNYCPQIAELLLKILPENVFETQNIVSDLLPECGHAMLVVPIDKEAPKGRLILPQVQTIRELLDNDMQISIVTEKGIVDCLNNSKKMPDIVVTDSQAFKKVSELVPENILLTSFSILFARLKGDLMTFFEGTQQIDKLQNGDKVLICESCTHHSIEDDIAKVKIPKLLKMKTGKDLSFEFYSSHDFAENIEQYKLIIHCGGCMTTRREILNRIAKCKKACVPITNYGMTIAHCLDILPRAMKPFFE